MQRASADGRACSWCGSGPLARSRVHPRLALCGACGVAVTDPPPTEQELARAYGAWYRPRGGRFAGPGDAFLRWSRGQLARRLDRLAPPGPVLDVGSGDGALLDALRARGRHAEGVERQGAPGVRAGDVTDVSGEWAAVVFWHSLEHQPRAGDALGHAASLLGPGGVLVVAAPNFESLQARLFAGRWLALDLPRHLVHLSPRALRERLQQLGLRVTRVSAVRGGQSLFGWLHGVVGSVPATGDLYDAIRRPEARSGPVGPLRRAATLGAACALLPAAAGAAAAEAALGRGGSLYVEARRA